MPRYSVGVVVQPVARPGLSPGFALGELLVVLAAFGLLLLLAAPRFDYQRYRVNASARAVATALGYGQRQAITLQHDVRVAFDTAGRRLRIHEDANNDAVLDVGERVTWVELGEGAVFGRGGADAAPFGTRTVSFTRTQGALPVVVFRRDGTASENGCLYLTTQRALAQGRAHDARAVEVIRASGRAFWYAGDGAAWQRGS